MTPHEITLILEWEFEEMRDLITGEERYIVLEATPVEFRTSNSFLGKSALKSKKSLETQIDMISKAHDLLGEKRN